MPARRSYKEWKRIVDHKRNKQEQKELMETWNALTNDYNKPKYFDIEADWRTETFGPLEPLLSKHTDRWMVDFSKEVSKAFGLPRELLGKDNGRS